MSVDLTDLDKDYDESGVLPDRIYHAEVIESDVKYSKTGKRQLFWKLSIVHPEKYEGQYLYLNKMLEGFDSAAWFAKQMLQKLGYMGPLSQVDMSSFIGQHWQVELKTNQKDSRFKDIEFLQRLNDGVASTKLDKPAISADDLNDDIPF
jgi:hypothetical protein